VDKKKQKEIIDYLLPDLKRVAYHIYKSIPPTDNVDFEDLLHEAIVGVLTASKKLKENSFDNNGQLKPFAKNYLLLRAKGAIFDFLRKLDFGSKNIRFYEKKIKHAYAELRKQLGREPTEEEVAQFLDISVEQLNKLHEKIAFSYVLSLEEVFSKPYEKDFLNFEKFLKSESKDIEEIIERKELINILKKGLAQLDDKELLVLQLYFFEELRIEDIAKILGLTPGRITQIKKQAIKKLKEYMENFL
jgi:RNA polymerase sigma factor for flagellar operon FliA